MLDHGSGTGEVALALHRRWPDARIVALDPDRLMLERLQEKAGLAPWLAVREGHLHSGLDLGPFDLCVSQLALVFVPDPRTELAMLRRITRPSGRLAVIVLREAAAMVPFFVFWTATRQVVPGAIAPEDYPHHRFAEGEALGAVAKEAGWDQVRVVPLAAERVCGEATLWRWLSTTLPIRLNTGDTVDLPSDARVAAAVRRALGELVKPYRRGDSYHLPTGAWLLTAIAR